ncbi:MAG: DEDD exonuclease domain-containing protein [Candidatus Tectomicrobia bacterium]|nr:DEDD exonuclease domain-containing protein [Candidatus Tectomicrobia bacterium]
MPDIKERILAILKERGGVVYHEDLAREIFKAEHISPTLSVKLVGSIVRYDPRFSLEGDYWKLNPAYLLQGPSQDSLRLLDFTVVDIETTGGGPPDHKITEIAAVKVREMEIVEHFQTLVNPERSIPPFITRLTGITNEMVAPMPTIDQIMPKFLNFLGSSVFVAHNASFDLKFIDHAVTVFKGEGLSNPQLCTYRLARKLLPDLPKRSLDSLSAYFAIGIEGRHRAFGDALATAKILGRFLEMLFERNIETLEELLEFIKRRPKPLPSHVQIDPLKLSRLPEKPGVYLMKDEMGKILYIGKAKNLRQRVRSYFSNGEPSSKKVVKLVRQVHDLDFSVTGSELSALILESRLIKEHLPHFNFQIRNHRSYPYIKINLLSPFPRVYTTRTISADQGLYFGPYRSSRVAGQLVKEIETHFLLRKCTEKLIPDEGNRPCAYYEMNLCSAPCAKMISKEAYHDIVKNVIQFLRGDCSLLLDRLEAKRDQLSEGMQFEEAALVRDQINALRELFEKGQLPTKAVHETNLLILMPGVETETLECFLIQSGRFKAQFVVNPEKSDLAPLFQLIEETCFLKEDQEPKVITKEEADEMRILSNWLLKNRYKKGMLDLNSFHTPEEAFNALETLLLNHHSGALSPHSHR